jgi:hypothetical protein
VSDEKDLRSMAVLGKWVKWPWPLTDIAPALWEPISLGDDKEVALVVGEDLFQRLREEDGEMDEDLYAELESFFDDLGHGIHAEAELKTWPANNIDSDFDGELKLRFYKKGKR